jgi:hypothetical protein
MGSVIKTGAAPAAKINPTLFVTDSVFRGFIQMKAPPKDI